MEEGYNTKEVYYSLYCPKCRYKNVPENNEPCEECLTSSMRYASHKPMKFEKGVTGNGRKQVSKKGQ